MRHVIGVLLLKRNKQGMARFGTLDLDKCESWCERHPKKSFAIWLHRSRTSRWVMECRYVNFHRRDHAEEIEAEMAAFWLMGEEYEVTDELSKALDIEDIHRVKNSQSRSRVVNYCLNCLRKKVLQPIPILSECELDIIDAVGQDVVSGKDLAARVGKTNNSHFRAILSRLVREDWLERSAQPRGYRKPR